MLCPQDGGKSTEDRVFGTVPQVMERSFAPFAKSHIVLYEMARADSMEHTFVWHLNQEHEPVAIGLPRNQDAHENSETSRRDIDMVFHLLKIGDSCNRL
uniref:Uncharacterized protein n=1 Tax=Acrobeloides nanus TaxID=290746 RepID=A0A914EM22_9BILA